MARVLVVEDDHVIQELIVHILEHEGYACDVASDGKAGVDLVRECKPDVVLMDLMLPVMNGVDAVRAIRSDPDICDCHIIAMSAGMSLTQISGDFDVNGVILKPFDLEVLIADVAIQARQASAN